MDEHKPGNAGQQPETPETSTGETTEALRGRRQFVHNVLSAGGVLASAGVFGAGLLHSSRAAAEVHPSSSSSSTTTTTTQQPTTTV